MTTLNLRELGVRGVNAALYAVAKDSNDRHWVVEEPMGQHAIACGLDAPLNVEIDGHAAQRGGDVICQTWGDRESIDLLRS